MEKKVDWDKLNEVFYFNPLCLVCKRTIRTNAMTKKERDIRIAEHMKKHGIKKWWRYYKTVLPENIRDKFGGGN
jgi:hypothetical protein